MNKRLPQRSPDFPDSFYRVSVKGLCVEDGKLLLVHDMVDSDVYPEGKWELPGGGLDFGETPQQTLRREIKEEMGLEATWVAEQPKFVWQARKEGARGLEWYYVLLACYEIKLKDTDFTPSEECRAIQFYTKEELKTLNIADQCRPIIDLFNPEGFKGV